MEVTDNYKIKLKHHSDKYYFLAVKSKINKYKIGCDSFDLILNEIFLIFIMALCGVVLHCSKRFSIK